MEVVKFKDHSKSTSSWTVQEMLGEVGEYCKNNPEYTEAIVILKTGKAGQYAFTKFVVNLRPSEQIPLLEATKEVLVHELLGLPSNFEELD